MIFWIKFAQKGYLQSKSEKVNTAIKFCVFEFYSLWAKSQIRLTILIFWTKFFQKVYSQSETEKMDMKWILYIRFSPGTKFHLKLMILIFWIKFVQKEYFQSKTEKLHFSVHPWALLTILNFSVQELTDTTVF